MRIEQAPSSEVLDFILDTTKTSLGSFSSDRDRNLGRFHLTCYDWFVLPSWEDKGYWDLHS